MGADAESYMRKGFLIYEEIRKYLTIYEEAVSHICMTLQPIPSEFPFSEENFDFFYQCNPQTYAGYCPVLSFPLLDS
jgi:hypothetical protein